jgi:predicted nucleic acid-binding protein
VNRLYFIDAWYFIALFDTSDSHHSQVRALDRTIARMPVATHDGVLTEFLAFFAEDGPMVRQRVVKGVRDMLANRRFTIARMSDLFPGALTLYERRPDKGFSLTDCASMVLMKRLDISHVLTNDHHFRQEGFVVVNE